MQISQQWLSRNKLKRVEEAIHGHKCTFLPPLLLSRLPQRFIFPHSKGLRLREPGNLEKGGILRSLRASAAPLCYSMCGLLTPSSILRRF